MSAPSGTAEVTLLGRRYRVACEPGQRPQLDAAAAYLDGRLHELSERTRALGERLAVMAALNLAAELLELKSGVDVDALKGRISAMGSRIDDALAQQEPLF